MQTQDDLVCFRPSTKSHSSSDIEPLYWYSCTNTPVVALGRGEKLKKRVFQQPIGNENTKPRSLQLGSRCSNNGVLLLRFL